MTITCSYNPKNETARTGKVDLFVYIKYKIHPELEEEFPTKYPSEFYFPMDKIEAGEDEDKVEYDYDFETKLPYGKIEEKKILVRARKPKGASEDDPPPERKSIPQTEEAFIHWDIVPQPISVEDQKARDDLEEQENREREQKARVTQIKLEEEKARLRAEQQQIIMKQEQNIARLKVYFRAIEVAFHEQKENFNVTMSYMSIYHLELLENFDYYASTF